LSRNIRPINPTITLETNSNNYKSISNQKSKNKSSKKINFMETTSYLNTAANKSLNKISKIKTNFFEKKKINYDSNLFKKSNLYHLNLNKPNAKINNYDNQKINFEKAKINQVYNFKNDQSAIIKKSKNYSKEKSIGKNSDSYFRVNSTTLGNCNVSSENSLINLGQKNIRKISNVSKNEISIYNLNNTLKANNNYMLKKKMDAVEENNFINNNYYCLNKVYSNNSQRNIPKSLNKINSNVIPIMPPKKDCSLSKSVNKNPYNAFKNNYVFIEKSREKINTSSYKKNNNKINFSNQSLNYKNIKNDFSLIRKKSPNSNFKIFSKNTIKGFDICKKEANINFNELNMYKEIEVIEKKNNFKKHATSSKNSNKINEKNGFSSIKNVKFNINNANENANNHLNSENSLGIYANSVLQTYSNLSSNNPYLETKFTNNANNSNSQYVYSSQINNNSNNKSDNADIFYNNKTSAYKNYNILNLSPKKGQRVKLLNKIKKKEKEILINGINSIIINENKVTLTDNQSHDCYLDNLNQKKNSSYISGGMRVIKYSINPQK
jgi:hypothetical protein